MGRKKPGGKNSHQAPSAETPPQQHADPVAPESPTAKPVTPTTSTEPVRAVSLQDHAVFKLASPLKSPVASQAASRSHSPVIPVLQPNEQPVTVSDEGTSSRSVPPRAGRISPNFFSDKKNKIPTPHSSDDEFDSMPELEREAPQAIDTTVPVVLPHDPIVNLAQQLKIWVEDKKNHEKLAAILRRAILDRHIEQTSSAVSVIASYVVATSTHSDDSLNTHIHAANAAQKFFDLLTTKDSNWKVDNHLIIAGSASLNTKVIQGVFESFHKDMEQILRDDRANTSRFSRDELFLLQKDIAGQVSVIDIQRDAKEIFTQIKTLMLNEAREKRRKISVATQTLFTQDTQKPLHHSELPAAKRSASPSA